MVDNTRVYNCDCLPAMREFPDKYFDLAIVDPPYGIDMSNGSSFFKKHQGKDWDYVPSKEYFDELFRTTKDQIIFGGNYFELPITQGWFCWDKMFSEDIRGKGLSKSGIKRHDVSDFELVWTSFLKKSKFIRYTFIGNLSGFDDTLKVDYDYTGKIHPTQKPIRLYKWLLKNYAKEGDKILDTHLGSGSSRIAAFDMGFDFTGYELDKDYFDAQEKRFRQHKSQLKLFV